MRSARSGRALTPREQLDVLGKIWRPARDGYVFLPWISGESPDKSARRKNYHEGRAYLWPKEKSAILAHLEAHQGDDLYFCPNLFNGKRRQEELVYAEMSLYADLDEVDPRRLPSDRKPTIAWESSPGRFQGVWLLGGMLEGATWPGGYNQRLTYELGADLSGWDSTQLLRVPGKANYKPEYRDRNEGEPAAGTLVWDNGPRYAWGDFDDLPEIGQIGDRDEFDLLDEELLDGIDRHETWRRVRMRCSAAVRRYMAARSEADAADVDRSDVLWQIERDLADAGCTLAEIVAVVRPTVWNKYKGRNDELRRLKTEAAKAIGESRDGESAGALEVVGDAKPKTRTTIDDLCSENIRRPQWLIKDVWPEGGCGFIAGAPKSYKSWVALDMAVALASGAPFLGRFPVLGRGRKVLILQQEDSKALVRERFGVVADGVSPPHHRAGMLRWSERWGRVEWQPPLPLGLWIEVRTGFTASDESWQSWLEEYVAEEGIDLVLIDTLFTSAGNLDLDKSQELMTKMLSPLRAIADRNNCAVAIVHHNKKDSYGNGKDGDAEVTSGLSARAGKDMLGTVAMHAWVDTSLYVRARRPVARVAGVAVEAGGRDGGDRSGGESGGAEKWLGVPGVEVFVERETKLAEDLRFRVGIPRMSRGPGAADDDRALAAADRWMPQVTMGWKSETEGDEVKNPGDGRWRPERDHQQTRVAGRLIVVRLSEMGVTAERGKTIEEICEVLDKERRGVSKQLKGAGNNGWVVKKDDVWYLTEEGVGVSREKS